MSKQAKVPLNEQQCDYSAYLALRAIELVDTSSMGLDGLDYLKEAILLLRNKLNDYNSPKPL